MRKLFVLAASVFALTSCTKESITGSGPITSDVRNLSNFTGVATNGSTDVHIMQGANFKVELKGYSNLLPYMETKLWNNILEIGYKNGSRIKNDNVEVYVTMPAMESVKLSGSANIDVKGPFTGPSLEASVSGSGNIFFEQGTTDLLTAYVSGSGNIRAFGVLANKADVTISGSGTSEVHAVQQLKANIAGSGILYYKGTPTIESSISGSGKLVHRP